MIDANELDLAIVTNCEHHARLGDVPPRAAAVGDVEPAFDASRGARCRWRSAGRPALAAHRDRTAGDDRARPITSLYTSSNASAVASAVLSGWRCRCCRNRACGPACACSPPRDGFPELPSCRVGLVRNAHESSTLADALAEHIISSLDNLSERAGGGVDRLILIASVV